jgi:ribosomal protein L37AE/L43A
MSVKTATVFTCNMCGTSDHGIENCYDVPQEWFTIRISKAIAASTADDLHICPSCQYETVESLWRNI